MEKKQAGNKGPKPAPASSSAGRGRGRGKPNNINNTNNTITNVGSQATTAPFPKGSRVVCAPDGSSLIIDQGGNLLATIPSTTPMPQAAPGQFEDASGFQLSAGQAKKVKKAAARKAKEEKYAEFFKKGGTHTQLDVVLNQAAQSSSGARPSHSKTNPNPGSGGPVSQGQDMSKKRKRPATSTPSGFTPAAKLPNTTVTPPPPPSSGGGYAAPSSGGGYAAAAKRHAERQRVFHRERAQELNPNALHVYLGKQDKGPMNKATYDKFREVLMSKVLGNAVLPKPVLLRVEYTNWSSRMGAGVIACLDKLTARWYTEVVDAIELDTGVSFRAYAAPRPQTGKATFNAKGLNVSVEEVLTLVTAYNPELNGEVKTTRSNFILAKNTGDPIFEFALSDTAAAILGTRRPRWKLNLGSDQRKVKYYGKMDCLQRLIEADHELAEPFRTLGMTDGDEEEEDMDTGETDGARANAEAEAQDQDVDPEGLLNSSPLQPT
jgi:hypothetical protein